MNPRYYLSTEIFDREREKIFRKVWLFAGLKTLLPGHNNFMTRKLAGIPVVIQNFDGVLHAFENVCLHRSAPLQSDPIGCRPLICPYHAWKYDAAGQVCNIPRCDTLYRLDSTSLKLREFPLQLVGNLLFINMSSNPLPLEEQYSPQILATLESSSNSYDSEVMMTTWQCRFNWKLVYENLRDTNHVAFVHPRSLAPFVNFIPAVNQDLASESVAPLPDTGSKALRREMRRFSYGGPEGNTAQIKPFEWHEHVERWSASNASKTTFEAAGETHCEPITSDQDNAYFNWLAYPNLHIASGNGGHSFVIEHHIPIAPDRTDVEIYRFTAKKSHPYPTSNQVLLSEMHHSKLILGEDFGLLEKVQATLHLDAPVPHQGLYESTNRLVERWYTTLMETDCGL